MVKKDSAQQGPHRLLRRREVERLTGMGRSTLYLAISEGRFPKPIHITNKAVAWIEAEISAWQAARIAERDSLKEVA